MFQMMRKDEFLRKNESEFFDNLNGLTASEFKASLDIELFFGN
jgi:hypothetical protein